MSIKLYAREHMKMLLQHSLLPAVYKRAAKNDVQKGLVIFADSHNDSLPFSMQKMFAEIKALGKYDIKIRCRDLSKMPRTELTRWLIDFMELYARAEYVFICDNFLPVSSCEKRAETTVVQLWHSGGLLKKSGYDQPYSVPEYYKGNVFANYDLLTVSAEPCVSVFTSMMRQSEGVVRATGISRTDMYYNSRFLQNCKREFYESCPEAENKKVILYAPTFRGSAAEPSLVGEEEIDRAFEGHDEFFLVKKLHPHFERKNSDRVSCEIPTERLLPVADLLITDFSSVLFDYCIFDKPFVIFAPDYDKYISEVGFYVDIRQFPTTIVKDGERIIDAVRNELYNRKKEELETFRQFHMGECDGKATKRIMEMIGINNRKED